MGTTYRQDLARLKEIEVGDTLTYHVDSMNHTVDRWVTDSEGSTSWVPVTEVITRRGGFFPSGKVVSQEPEGWKINDKAGTIVTADLFWGLRKAPGRGKTGENRFKNHDAQVSCQCCAGSWIGNTGLTPHHGYERPGWGVQSPSCEGAREFPYSVIKDDGGKVSTIGRDVLPKAIAAYDFHILRQSEYLAKVEAGTIPLPSNYEKSTSLSLDDKRRLPIEPGHFNYPDIQNRKIRELRRDIEILKTHQVWIQDRYDTWKPGGLGVERADVVREKVRKVPDLGR